MKKFYKVYVNPSASYWEDKSKPIEPVEIQPVHNRLIFDPAYLEEIRLVIKNYEKELCLKKLSE